jgi:Flp pilus assembly protein TadD
MMSMRFATSVLALVLVGGGLAIAPAADAENRRERAEREREASASGQERPRFTRRTIATADVVSQAAFWAAEYERNSGDWEAAYNYSIALRSLGRFETAIAPSTAAFMMRRGDMNVAYQHGITLLSAGRPEGAIEPLRLAAEANATNWRAQTALAAAFDLSGDKEEASTWHAKAMATAPQEPTVHVNKAMSLLLVGDAPAAETVLRAAMRLPNAGAEVRQNLALALGVQGKFEEAERLSRTDLPPDVAVSNVAYMRSLLAESRRYSQETAPQRARN